MSSDEIAATPDDDTVPDQTVLPPPNPASLLTKRKKTNGDSPEIVISPTTFRAEV